METIASRDGTRIAFTRTGAGPALVLVHGTSADHGRWAPILPQLAARFTVLAMDRRGRGESGDAPAYEIEREFEDVAALVDAAGAPAFVLGHSYGAICALEAALRTPNVRRLALYEPPIPVGRPTSPPGAVERLQALADRGAHDELVTTFFRELVRMPPQELAMMRSLPSWPDRVAAAPTIPRELRASDAYVIRPERLAQLRVPTLLLVGGDSPPRFQDAIGALRGVIPGCRVSTMAGQQHAAINTAPELFLREVTGFLLEDAASGGG